MDCKFNEILQINAKWNQHNNVLLDKMPKNYRGYIIKVKYALLEEQGPGFKKSFAGKPLPIVVLRIGCLLYTSPRPRD